MRTAIDDVALFESNLVELGGIHDCVDLLRDICLMGIGLRNQMEIDKITVGITTPPGPISIALGHCVAPIISGNNSPDIYRIMMANKTMDEITSRSDALKAEFGCVNAMMTELLGKLPTGWCHDFSTRAEVKNLHPWIEPIQIETVGELVAYLEGVKIRETLITHFHIPSRKKVLLGLDMLDGNLSTVNQVVTKEYPAVNPPRNISSERLTVGGFLNILRTLPMNCYIAEINLNGKANRNVGITMHQTGVRIFD